MLERLKRRFGKKKEEPIVEEVKEKDLIGELCGDDKDLHEAIDRVLLLDPRKSKKSMSESESEAKSFKAEGDFLNAYVSYHHAIGLAISEGYWEKVKEYSLECAELSNALYAKSLYARYFRILSERAEDVIKIAQVYYQEELKPIEKKE